MIPKTNDIERLQANLNTIRKVAGWTAQELGDRIGVTKQTISNLEKTGDKPKAKMTLTQYLAIRCVLDYEMKYNNILSQVVYLLLDVPADELSEYEISKITHSASMIGAAFSVGTDNSNEALWIEQEVEKHKGKVSRMSDDELMKYVPCVYQEKMTDIAYDRFKDRNIKFLSIDIDNIVPNNTRNNTHALEEIQKQFANLIDSGFVLTLITKEKVKVAEVFSKSLPLYVVIYDEQSKSVILKDAMKRYNAEPSQMAHIGTSIIHDIYEANIIGITSVMVRKSSSSANIAKLFGRQSKSHKIRDELQKRNIWYKHHKNIAGDQYYQIGERPTY